MPLIAFVNFILASLSLSLSVFASLYYIKNKFITNRNIPQNRPVLSGHSNPLQRYLLVIASSLVFVFLSWKVIKDNIALAFVFNLSFSINCSLETEWTNY